jgi:hypothetical protein
MYKPIFLSHNPVCDGCNALFNTQNVMEKRLGKCYYFEVDEFENDTEIFSLALVFELQLWTEISLYSTKC